MVFLVGCNDTSNLSYLGDDKNNISQDHIVNATGFDIPIYIKEIETGEIAIGAFDSTLGYFLGVVIRIKNTGYEPITLTQDDITVKTEDNYRLKKVYPDSYISAVLGRTQQSTETNVYVNQDPLPNSNSPYVASQRLGNAISDLGNTISDQQIWEAKEKMKRYAQEVDTHALRQTVKIEPQSWDYYYVFFEKPRQYPVIVSCQNIVYKFGK